MVLEHGLLLLLEWCDTRITTLWWGAGGGGSALQSQPLLITVGAQAASMSAALFPLKSPSLEAYFRRKEGGMTAKEFLFLTLRLAFSTLSVFWDGYFAVWFPNDPVKIAGYIQNTRTFRGNHQLDLRDFLKVSVPQFESYRCDLFNWLPLSFFYYSKDLTFRLAMFLSELRMWLQRYIRWQEKEM